MGKSRNYKIHVKSDTEGLIRIFGYKSMSALYVDEEIFLPYKAGNLCVKITSVKHGLKNIAFAEIIEKQH